MTRPALSSRTLSADQLGCVQSDTNFEHSGVIGSSLLTCCSIAAVTCHLLNLNRRR